MTWQHLPHWPPQPNEIQRSISPEILSFLEGQRRYFREEQWAIWTFKNADGGHFSINNHWLTILSTPPKNKSCY